MTLRPLGHRILVIPDAPPTTTDSGLIQLQEDRHHVPTSGTVVEVGDGPVANQRVRQAVIARCMAIVTEMETAIEGHYPHDVPAAHALASQIRDEMRRYKNRTEPIAGTVKVGDRVVFPVECGLNVDVDNVRHLILNEDDVAVIADDEQEAA